MPWPSFVLLFPIAYVLINLVFALGYLVLGPGALEGPAGPELGERALQAFFFSVHTFSAIGYGHIVPVGFAANVLVSIEAIVELFMVALATGLVLARFSRPVARILYSDRAVIAPYLDGRGFMFRIANLRKSQILDLEVKVILSRMVEEDGRLYRRFWELPLERQKVTFFPLSWTIVHPIGEQSPFADLDDDACRHSDVEVLVLLQGMDDSLSEAVHSRCSYVADEMVWNARFNPIIRHPTEDEDLSIDIGRLHEIESISPPTA